MRKAIATGQSKVVSNTWRFAGNFVILAEMNTINATFNKA